MNYARTCVTMSIRYNRPGGKVQLITACGRDGHCTLTVRDNGIGIPAEAQSSVFERFYRVDKSRSKATGGTGLGLAIVKHIARIHNARIKLESEVDVGTTITVTFKIDTEPLYHCKKRTSACTCGQMFFCICTARRFWDRANGQSPARSTP